MRSLTSQVKKYWSIVPHMIQPPIEVKDLVSSPRKSMFLQIVSVGRLDPDKHYEDIIEAIGKSNTLREKH